MADAVVLDERHRELTIEEDFRQVESAQVVNIISTPWHETNPTAGRKAAATKVIHDNPQAGIYTFNPNTGLPAAAFFRRPQNSSLLLPILPIKSS